MTILNDPWITIVGNSLIYKRRVVGLNIKWREKPTKIKNCLKGDNNTAFKMVRPNLLSSESWHFIIINTLQQLGRPKSSFYKVARANDETLASAKKYILNVHFEQFIPYFWRNIWKTRNFQACFALLSLPYSLKYYYGLSRSAFVSLLVTIFWIVEKKPCSEYLFLTTPR